LFKCMRCKNYNGPWGFQKKMFNCKCHLFQKWRCDICMPSVTTLALGTGQEECKRVWGWRLTLPSELPFWESKSQWTPKPSGSDCKGQNTSHWRVPYIIGKLLKFRCLKWARMTHLDIYNTSYGKKKGRESNWQFDSRPQNVRNQPDFHVCKWCVAHHWKALDESYNFALDLVPIGGLSTEL
jgi:hypothetical protein